MRSALAITLSSGWGLAPSKKQKSRRLQRGEYNMLSRALRSLSLAVALCVTGAAAARPQTNALPPVSAAGGKIHIRAVGPIAITVEDMDRSVDFYTHVLT